MKIKNVKSKFSMSEVCPLGGDKVARYGWSELDDVGSFQFIPKELLNVDPSYQRSGADVSDAKIKELTANWSWAACGVISVSRRQDGSLWATDGQHRVLAALRRSDIAELPCIVFDNSCVADEAKTFVALNTNRRNVSAVAKFQASVVANDGTAIKLQALLSKHSVKIRDSDTCVRSKGCVTKCVAELQKMFAKDPVRVDIVLSVAAPLCEGEVMSKSVVQAVNYVHENVEGGLFDTRLKQRIFEVGLGPIESAIRAAQMHFNRYDAKVAGHGMLNALNKHLKRKFTFKL